MATLAQAAPVEQRVDVNPWIIAVAVMLGTFMEVLDTTVVNVSLPHIAGNLGATVDEATWVLTSYLVANAIILPMTGWLANQFGRKRILLLSVGGFTVSSFLCGLAPSLPLLIIFRILQGATGGGLQPLSQAILMESFPPDKRGKAMAFWALGIVVAPMLGPVMGGWITDSFSWRWIFFINNRRRGHADDQYVRDRPAVHPPAEQQNRLLGNRSVIGRDWRTPNRARQRSGGRLVRVALGMVGLGGCGGRADNFHYSRVEDAAPDC